MRVCFPKARLTFGSRAHQTKSSARRCPCLRLMSLRPEDALSQPSFCRGPEQMGSGSLARPPRALKLACCWNAEGPSRTAGSPRTAMAGPTAVRPPASIRGTLNSNTTPALTLGSVSNIQYVCSLALYSRRQSLCSALVHYRYLVPVIS